jgi:hypothetical protein
MEEEILAIFEDIQVSKRSHKSVMKKLQNFLSHENSRQLALEVILNCILDQTLAHTKSSANIQRIIDFFGQFFAAVDDGLKPEIFEHLFSRLKSTLKHVRQRTCNIIAGFLYAVTESEIELDCDLINDITSNTLTRLFDKIPTVRIAAVNALMHLQNPEDAKDPVIEKLMELFAIDNTPSVRNAIARALTLCDSTKDLLISRLKDISPEVRISIITKLYETDVRQFTKLTRVDIVSTVLNDRNSKVRSAGDQLLINWLSLLNYDLTKFISYFNSIENEKLVVLILSWLAEKVYNPNKGVSSVDIKKLEVLKHHPFVWKTSLNEFSTTDLIWFICRCNYGDQFLSKFQFQQLFYQLLNGCSSDDTEDVNHEHDDQVIEEKCMNIFTKTNFMNLKNDASLQMNLKYFLQLVSYYYAISFNRSNPFQSTPSSISDSLLKEIFILLMNAEKMSIDNFQFILTSLWTMPQLKHSNSFSDFLEEMSRDFEMNSGNEEVKGSEESEETEESIENNDKKIRCLLIIQSLLQNQPYKKAQMEKHFNFVLHCLQQSNSYLRAYATTSLGIFCIYDSEIRTQYLRVIKQIFVGEFEEEIVLKNSFKALIDLCLIAGDEFTPEEKREIDNYLVRQLQNLPTVSSFSEEEAEEMGSYYDEFLLSIMEGTVKLVFNGFSKDPSLVSKLLQFFFIDGKELESRGKLSMNNESTSPAADAVSTLPSIMKMNQMLSLFLHSFLLTDESCLEVVRLSLSLFISDCVIAIRDERMTPDSLGKIMESLFGICQEVLTAFSEKQSEESNYRQLLTSYRFLVKTAFACLCCEILKLGNQDKTEKIMRKDFIRELLKLSSDWYYNEEISSIRAVLDAIKSSGPLDKASEKILAGIVVNFEPHEEDESIAK